MKTFLTRDQFTQYYTATGGETQITLTRTVCRTNTDFAVFRNGLFQTPGSTADYVFIDRYGVEASNTEAFVSAIKFNTALSLNDKVSIVSGVISGTNLADIYNYIGDTGVSTNLITPYNLNNLIHGGRYFLAYNAGNTNCPVSVDCHIQVFQKDSGNMVQTIYPVDGTSPVWRSYSNGTWNGWNTYSDVVPVIEDRRFVVGEFYYFRHPTIKPGFAPLQGGLISGAYQGKDITEYPIWEYLQTAEGQLLLKTEAEWQAMTTATWHTNADGTKIGWDGIGGAPFYVQDLGAGTLRMPDLRGMYAEAAGFDSLGVGGVQGDAVRNITGSLGGALYLVTSDTAKTATGVFANSSFLSTTDTGFESRNISRRYSSLKINASASVPTGAANAPRRWGALACCYLGTPAS